MAFASLLTGLIQSLGTPWGLFRHYRVVVKLLLTVFATAVLLVKMELIGYAARPAAETTLSRADLRAAGSNSWFTPPASAGVARARGTLSVQAARRDPVRAARTV